MKEIAEHRANSAPARPRRQLFLGQAAPIAPRRIGSGLGVLLRQGADQRGARGERRRRDAEHLSG